ncbi:glycosyltransferase [Turicibacter sp. KK003]|uniref:glycosyltransferase n=1 Tax=Turicibacter sp. KK003 TaxID=3114695 RepID=UPI0030CD7027|nr:glycosyltransferase [Clostridiales bacterium]
MKKKLLFVIDSLPCAGAEKSLITLLSQLDYEQYEVDLQLFAYGWTLDELVPKEVNFLPPLSYTNYSNQSLKQMILNCRNLTQFKMIVARLRYSLFIRKGHLTNAQMARLYWQSIGSVIEKNEKVYDVAISYAQGIPTFYVADKTRAAKKYAWVNVSYTLGEEDRLFQEKYYQAYERIVAVSESAEEIFLESFPMFKDRMTIIYDINDYQMIKRMSELEPEFKLDVPHLKLLTIGRLNHQKGYDIALEAARLLKERGILFTWYVLGKGGLYDEIKQTIQKYGLEKEFILLGITANPYPMIKQCDIYVQTSKFEGYGLAIAEARMLNKPVVTTKFDAVFNQMVHEKNGLVTTMDGVGVADGIERLLKEPDLYHAIVDYLNQEKKGNVEEIAYFYQLIEKGTGRS